MTSSRVIPRNLIGCVHETRASDDELFTAQRTPASPASSAATEAVLEAWLDRTMIRPSNVWPRQQSRISGAPYLPNHFSLYALRLVFRTQSRSVPQSRRDCVTQPRVGRAAGYPGSTATKSPATLKGLHLIGHHGRHGRGGFAGGDGMEPFQGSSISAPRPRVGAARQPLG